MSTNLQKIKILWIFFPAIFFTCLLLEINTNYLPLPNGVDVKYTGATTTSIENSVMSEILSEKFNLSLEKLTHEVCLNNKNRLYYKENGISTLIDNDIHKSAGAMDSQVYFQDEKIISLYANTGALKCINVTRDILKSSKILTVFSVAKVLDGNNGTTTFETEFSRLYFHIKPDFWVIFWIYFTIQIAWCGVVLLFKKIYDFIIE